MTSRVLNILLSSQLSSYLQHLTQQITSSYLLLQLASGTLLRAGFPSFLMVVFFSPSCAMSLCPRLKIEYPKGQSLNPSFNTFFLTHTLVCSSRLMVLNTIRMLMSLNYIFLSQMSSLSCILLYPTVYPTFPPGGLMLLENLQCPKQNNWSVSKHLLWSQGTLPELMATPIFLAVQAKMLGLSLTLHFVPYPQLTICKSFKWITPLPPPSILVWNIAIASHLGSLLHLYSLFLACHVEWFF